MKWQCNGRLNGGSSKSWNKNINYGAKVKQRTCYESTGGCEQKRREKKRRKKKEKRQLQRSPAVLTFVHKAPSLYSRASRTISKPVSASFWANSLHNTRPLQSWNEFIRTWPMTRKSSPTCVLLLLTLIIKWHSEWCPLPSWRLLVFKPNGHQLHTFKFIFITSLNTYLAVSFTILILWWLLSNSCDSPARSV